MTIPRGYLEEVPEGEDVAIKTLTELAIADMIHKAADGKPSARGQHPKHHGFQVATFTVLGGLPEELTFGLFREPRTYTAVVRFSNTGEADDAVRDNHGMSLKLLGVAGKKLLEDEKDAETQDFVLLDHPLFFSRDVASLVEFSKVLAELLTDAVLQERLKGLPPEQRAKEFGRALFDRRPEESRLLEIRKILPPSPLAPDYFSTTPYLLGTAAVKYGAKPKPPAPPNPAPPVGKDAFRAALVEQLTTRRQPAAFGFYVQRQGDPQAMPVEDPTVEWTSAWEEVATIEIGAQDFDFPAREEWGNALSFTPWHALAEHQPLGGINRARKVVYPAGSALRHRNLGVPPKEPTEADIPMTK